jgi:DNA polymerase III epsilon subunit-like protein
MKVKFDKETKFCFFDYETEGLNLGTSKPVQAAYFVYNGKGFKEKKVIYINWELANIPITINPGAEQVTGISREKVMKEGIHPDDALELNNFYFNSSDYILGHNIFGYDYHIYGVWNKLLKRKPIDITNKSIDTLAIAKGISYNIFYEKGMDLFAYMMSLTNYWERGKKNSIKELAKQYSINFDSAKLHDALYDIEINAKIWEKQKFQIDL